MQYQVQPGIQPQQQRAFNQAPTQQYAQQPQPVQMHPAMHQVQPQHQIHQQMPAHHDSSSESSEDSDVTDEFEASEEIPHAEQVPDVYNNRQTCQGRTAYGAIESSRGPQGRTAYAELAKQDSEIPWDIFTRRPDTRRRTGDFRRRSRRSPYRRIEDPIDSGLYAGTGDLVVLAARFSSGYYAGTYGPHQQLMQRLEQRSVFAYMDPRSWQPTLVPMGHRPQEDAPRMPPEAAISIVRNAAQTHADEAGVLQHDQLITLSLKRDRGACPSGFSWELSPSGRGYNCTAGNHFIPHSEIDMVLAMKRPRGPYIWDRRDHQWILAHDRPRPRRPSTHARSGSYARRRRDSSADLRCVPQ